jgi:IS30 family transposase
MYLTLKFSLVLLYALLPYKGILVENSLSGSFLLCPNREVIHTITSDNGSEFARHKQVAEALDINFYFARPYHSWERGANENLNG